MTLAETTPVELSNQDMSPKRQRASKTLYERLEWGAKQGGRRQRYTLRSIQDCGQGEGVKAWRALLFRIS